MLRFINTIFILILIGFFGLFDFTKDRLLGSLNTFDVILFLINIIFIGLLLHIKSMQRFIFKTPFKFIFALYGLALLIMCTMPLRGEIGIIDAIKVGRNFLLIPFAALIWFDLHTNHNQYYYRNLIYFIAGLTSFQIIMNAFNPSLISSLFEHVRAREHFLYGHLQRNDFLSKGMLFPHLATLIVFSFIIKNGLTKRKLLGFILFFVASGLQGFRSYFAVLCLILIGVLVYHARSRVYQKYILVMFCILPMLIVTDNFLLNKQIQNKFKSLTLVLENESNSSIEGRFDRDLIYRIPKFLEKPFIGWGFVHSSSQYGKEIGMKDIKDEQLPVYTLYSVDSGYLTLLNYFGGVGFILVLFLFIRFIHQVKIVKNIDSMPLIGFLVILLLPLVSHGGLYSDFGLIPFLIFTGYYFNRKNSFQNNYSARLT